MSKKTAVRPISRRDALMGLGASLAAFPLLQLLACESGDDSMGDGEFLDDAGTGATGDASASSGADAALDGGAANADSGASGNSDGGLPLTGWASGGTAALVAKASYPNPFRSGGSSCELNCEATIGPCHTTSPLRADVSDGWDGIPMRMSLRVVDQTCAPVVGALVEIWHTNYKGIYSGAVASLCNAAAEDKAAGYFRGYLVTDADGRVDFDSVFPGWYSSRAVHVHLRVLKGAYNAADAADAWVITQLMWPDELVQSIFTNQVLYKDKGLPDTLLSADNVIGGETDKSPYLFDVQQMSDGAMLASKTLVLRSALSDSLCTAQGAAGGMGGPPGLGDGGMGGPPGMP